MNPAIQTPLAPDQAPGHEHDPGARPAAETTEAAAAQHVRELFGSIAPTYDRLNHLLSFGLDRRWWRRSAATFREILARPEARILDLCCGTGDMTAALLALRPKPTPTPDAGCPLRTDSLTIGTGGVESGAPSVPTVSSSGRVGLPNADPAHTLGAPFIAQPHRAMSGVEPITEPIIEPILGLDFSTRMLRLAQQKYAHTNILWVEADAMALPYPDNTFDLITSAFGFRNLTHYAAALAEIHRVLRPGGRLGILEANQPGGLSGALYTLYFRHILPLIGGLVSGDYAAYQYLPASVSRFPRPPRMLQLMQQAGFTACAWDAYLLRAAGLYHGVKR